GTAPSVGASARPGPVRGAMVTIADQNQIVRMIRPTPASAMAASSPRLTTLGNLGIPRIMSWAEVIRRLDRHAPEPSGTRANRARRTAPGPIVRRAAWRPRAAADRPPGAR